MNLADEYLCLCKKNYIEKITPSNNSTHRTDGYKNIVTIAMKYFEKGKYEDFSRFFYEEKYLIPLWTAHMLLEFGKPSNELIISSLKVIENYLDNLLAPEVSNEEEQWLDEN